MTSFRLSLAIAAAMASCITHAAPLRGAEAFGLTADGQLVTFKVDRPQRARSIDFLSGFVTDTSLIGIDFRVQDGRLYGVGNAGGVYTIDLATAAMTRISASLTVTPSGTSFGVDFNPAADRLRVVSDTGQNLRHNVNLGGTTTTDTALSATGIVGAAYTNNDLNPATSTTLFDLDANLNLITIQSPANSGMLATAGVLGLDAQAAAGFDIATEVNRSGVAAANFGYAVLTPSGDGVPTLFRVDLLTGAATAVGQFPESLGVNDIALPTPAVSAPQP